MTGPGLLAVIQAIGPAILAVLAVFMFPQIRRKDRAATAVQVEEVARSSELRDAEREEREVKRYERLDKRLERAELNVEIMSAFIVYDEDYHFHEARVAAAEGRSVRERLTFDQFARKYRADWFVERLDQVITKRENEDEEGGTRGD